jgi:hypothetical protein
MSESEKCDHPKLFTTCQDCGDIFFSKPFKMQNGWIDISEQTPPLYDRLLVFSKSTGVIRAINKDYVFAKDGTFFHSPGKMKFEDDKIEGVTHWMPLPEPPK